jgi:hypothetical protein
MTVVALPTRSGVAGDAARRLARFVGPGVSARDGSRAAALYLALGTTIATTRAYTSRSLVEGFPHLAVDTLGAWERSLGMLSGEGDAVSGRQLALTARWRATHAGPSIDELYTTVATLDSTALVLGVALDDVIGTDPEATQRFVVLLGDALRADEGAVSRLAAALSVEAPAQVQFTFGRHHGGTALPRFRCAFRGNSADSRCDRDVLAR